MSISAPSRRPLRAGSVLLLVTGIVAMIAMLAAAFLLKMRSGVQDVSALQQLTQCRLMLHAAMAYIQEGSRLGYARMNADGTTADPREAWGWIDPRQPDAARVYVPPPALPALPAGQRYMIGPRDNAMDPLWIAGRWPDLATVVRCPMYMERLPPWAVQPRMSLNPIPTDPNDPATFGIPDVRNPDPLVALDPLAYPSIPAPGSAGAAAARTAWSVGDPTPVPQSSGGGWFRVYREDGTEAGRPAKAGPVGATFIVTVGSGATMGFRDWSEMSAIEQTRYFRGSQRVFNELLAGELRQWFRVEWSAAVGGGDVRLYLEANVNGDHSSARSSYYSRLPPNSSRQRSGSTTDSFDIDGSSSSAEPRNYIGTIRYIQRLDAAPSAW